MAEVKFYGRYAEDRAISLMLQGEADYYWAVSEDNLSLEDPPVDGYLLDYDTEKFAFFISLDSLFI